MKVDFFGVTLGVVQDCSLIQKKVLEGLQGVEGTFNENKSSELHKSEILKYKKENKKPDLINSELST